MKKILAYSILLIFFITTTIYSQKKLAQTGLQFLSVGTSARATAMGEAFTTVAGASASLFYNPAGLTEVSGSFDLSFNQMTWIADIQYNSLSMALKVKNGRYGVFGLSLLKVDYGEFDFTRVAENEQGYEDIEGWSQPTSYAVGLGYAKELTDKFVVGGQVKYALQNLGNSYLPIYTETDTSIEKRKYELGVLAFDFGTIYKTGLKSLAFGVTVRNFSQEVSYVREGFQLPLTFKIGVSMNMFDLLPGNSENHSLIMSIDAVHPRSFPEYLNIGGEYVFRNLLALRAGYISNQDEYGLTTGFGLSYSGIAIDYSFTPINNFEDINRFSVQFSF